MSKSGTIQSSIATLAGIAVVTWLQLCVFNSNGQSVAESPKNYTENTNTSGGDEIKQAIKTMNSSCPMKVDEQTRLDSVSYLTGNIFAYYFTLVNIERASIDTATAKPRIEESIVSNLKSNSTYDIYKKYNVTFLFNYKDKAENKLFNITITPSQYNN